MVVEFVVTYDKGHGSDVWPATRLWADATRVLREDCAFGVGKPRATNGLLRFVHTSVVTQVV